MLVLLLAVLLTRTRKEPLLRLGVCLLLPFTVAREGFHLAPFVVLASFACVHLLPSCFTAIEIRSLCAARHRRARRPHLLLLPANRA